MLSADALDLALRKANQGIHRTINLMNVCIREFHAKFLAELKTDLTDVNVVKNNRDIVMGKCVALRSCSQRTRLTRTQVSSVTRELA
jgi:hypothetical protein